MTIGVLVSSLIFGIWRASAVGAIELVLLYIVLVPDGLGFRGSLSMLTVLAETPPFIFTSGVILGPCLELPCFAVYTSEKTVSGKLSLASY